jgi:hypothetical protein
MDIRFLVRSFCLFYVLFSECGIGQGLSGVCYYVLSCLCVCVFSLFLGGGYRVSFVCVLGHSPTSLPTFMFYLFSYYILFRTRQYQKTDYRISRHGSDPEKLESDQKSFY